jgi:hypothetical protein
MKWQKLYSQLKKYQKENDIKQYCILFLEYMDTEINLSFEEFSKLLYGKSQEQLSFFPFMDNLQEYFSKGNYHFLAHLVYYSNELDLFLVDIIQTKEQFNSNFELLFNNSKHSIYNLNNIEIDKLLLSKDCKIEHLICFLFLLCLPHQNDNKNLVMFNTKGEHFLTSAFITDDNFDIMLHIAKEIHPHILNNILKADKNLSIFILEKFFTDIFFPLDTLSIDVFKNKFPQNKINKLSLLNCYPDDLSSYINSSISIMYENIITFIDNYSKELYKKNLLETLTFNIQEDKITKF